jgi:hypothetical protein
MSVWEQTCLSVTINQSQKRRLAFLTPVSCSAPGNLICACTGHNNHKWASDCFTWGLSVHFDTFNLNPTEVSVNTAWQIQIRNVKKFYSIPIAGGPSFISCSNIVKEWNLQGQWTWLYLFTESGRTNFGKPHQNWRQRKCLLAPQRSYK